MKALELKFDSKTMSGDFSDVFVDKENLKVYKLFRNQTHKAVTHKRGDREDQLRKLTYQAEVKAYEIVSKTAELRQYVPQYFGEFKVNN